ncbi:MAG: hypothetical protein K6B75_04040 [Lachnospiraceae bacterium]|nr:hypothetical protein [Lachnospiraceae bacterium]
MQDDIRIELIKQFPAEVIRIEDRLGSDFFVCPTCKHPVTSDMKKCAGCGQVLSWANVSSNDLLPRTKKALVHFDVPADFIKGDCRNCPIAKVKKNTIENRYECPIGTSNDCKLEFEK